MKQTPEGIVKDKVKKLMAKYGIFSSSQMTKALKDPSMVRGWYHMPVSLGMGAHGIPDFLGIHRSFAFTVETKKDSKSKPTKLQIMQMEVMALGGYTIFIVYDDNTLNELENWLISTSAMI